MMQVLNRMLILSQSYEIFGRPRIVNHRTIIGQSDVFAVACFWCRDFVGMLLETCFFLGVWFMFVCVYTPEHGDRWSFFM